MVQASNVDGPAYLERKSPSLREVPWQIWAVVALLAAAGFFDLLRIPQQPWSLWWFAAKCIFILGLLRAWRWVFCVFVVVGAIHVVFFSAQAPFIALLNLVLVVLVLSTVRFYFPRPAPQEDAAEGQGAVAGYEPSEPFEKGASKKRLPGGKE